MYWPYGNRQLKSPNYYASFAYAYETIFKLEIQILGQNPSFWQHCIVHFVHTLLNNISDHKTENITSCQVLLAISMTINYLSMSGNRLRVRGQSLVSKEIEFVGTNP